MVRAAVAPPRVGFVTGPPSGLIAEPRRALGRRRHHLVTWTRRAASRQPRAAGAPRAELAAEATADEKWSPEDGDTAQNAAVQGERDGKADVPVPVHVSLGLEDVVSSIVREQLEARRHQTWRSSLRALILTCLASLQGAITIAAALSLRGVKKGPQMNGPVALASHPETRMLGFLFSGVFSAILVALLSAGWIKRNIQRHSPSAAPGPQQRYLAQTNEWDTIQTAIQNRVLDTILRNAVLGDNVESARYADGFTNKLRDGPGARKQQEETITRNSAALKKAQQDLAAAEMQLAETQSISISTEARLVDLRNNNFALAADLKEAERAGRAVDSENARLVKQMKQLRAALRELTSDEQALQDKLEMVTERLNKLLTEKAKWIQVTDELTEEFEVERAQLLSQVEQLKDVKSEAMTVHEQTSTEHTHEAPDHKQPREAVFSFSRDSFENVGLDNVAILEEKAVTVIPGQKTQIVENNPAPENTNELKETGGDASSLGEGQHELDDDNLDINKAPGGNSQTNGKKPLEYVHGDAVDVDRELSIIGEVLNEAKHRLSRRDPLFEKADSAFAELNFLVPNDCRVLSAWGDCLLTWAKLDLGKASSNERLSRACEKFEQALSMKPDELQFLFNSGLSLSLRAVFEDGFIALETFVEACRKYDRIIELDPTNEMACFNLGLALYSRGRIQETPEGGADTEGAKLCYADAMNRIQASLDLAGSEFDDPKARGYIDECSQSLHRLSVAM